MRFHMELTGLVPRAVMGTSQHQQCLRLQALLRDEPQPNSPRSSLVLVSSMTRTDDAFKKQGSKIINTEVNTANVENTGTSARTQICVCLTAR